MTHGSYATPFGQLPRLAIDPNRHADKIEEMLAEDARFAFIPHHVSAVQAVEITREQLHRHAGVVELATSETLDMRHHLRKVGTRDFQQPIMGLRLGLQCARLTIVAENAFARPDPHRLLALRAQDAAVE